MTLAKWASTKASILSFLARRPIERANSRTRRGFTRNTGRPAWRSCQSALDSTPPLASSTICLTGRAFNHVIRDAIPASVLSKILCSSKTWTATSSVFLQLSIPTKTSFRSLIVIPSLPAQSCHAQPFGLYNERRPGPALRAAFAKPRTSRSPAAAGGSQRGPRRLRLYKTFNRQGPRSTELPRIEALYFVQDRGGGRNSDGTRSFAGAQEARGQPRRRSFSGSQGLSGITTARKRSCRMTISSSEIGRAHV